LPETKRESEKILAGEGKKNLLNLEKTGGSLERKKEKTISQATWQ